MGKEEDSKTSLGEVLAAIAQTYQEKQEKAQKEKEQVEQAMVVFDNPDYLEDGSSVEVPIRFLRIFQDRGLDHLFVDVPVSTSLDYDTITLPGGKVRYKGSRAEKFKDKPLWLVSEFIDGEDGYLKKPTRCFIKKGAPDWARDTDN